MKRASTIAATLSAAMLSASVAGFAFAGEGMSHDGHSGHDHGAGDEMTGADHAGHGMEDMGQSGHDTEHAAGSADHRMPDHLIMNDGSEIQNKGNGNYVRSLNSYHMPDVMLRDSTGARVKFSELMEYDGPVLLNFIFTSCATICPVMSATFGQTQPDLDAIHDEYMMVSISIDPEYDTPARLSDYAELHEAGDNWVFLTGSFDDIFQVVRAFDAIYKADNKMYHRPLTFLRRNADADWVRLEGLLTSAELAAEYTMLVTGEVN